METTLKRPVIATLIVAFLLIAIPTLAQTDTTRIEELEEKTAAMTGELSELGAELEKANQDDAVSDVKTLRSEVVKRRLWRYGRHCRKKRRITTAYAI